MDLIWSVIDKASPWIRPDNFSALALHFPFSLSSHVPICHIAILDHGKDISDFQQESVLL